MVLKVCVAIEQSGSCSVVSLHRVQPLQRQLGVLKPLLQDMTLVVEVGRSVSIVVKAIHFGSRFGGLVETEGEFDDQSTEIGLEVDVEKGNDAHVHVINGGHPAADVRLESGEVGDFDGKAIVDGLEVLRD